ncbi:DNA mismatch repair protein MutS [Flexistipes sp.]|uniref:DNA mismatch repair protein MutS n=1 Tax=Flexistipes sp. TaxID=3088135 RepID=UPI002E1B2CD3|nr:DNA mismatch repair protein MutS [Flexistipes sp.]
MKKTGTLTPMMAQYYEIKEKYPDHLLFFRMGDFYEMFGEDANVASRILSIALTSRNKKEENPVPMCGIPYHAYKSYLNKLLEAGKKVAICEQLEDPSTAKGIVKRGVTRVISPGTVIDEDSLESHDFNILMSAYKSGEHYHICAVDTSTGDTFLQQQKYLEDSLAKWNPKEIISNIDLEIKNTGFYKISRNQHIKAVEDKVTGHFGVRTPKSLGIYDKELLYPLSYILNYLEDSFLEVSLKKPVFLTAENEVYLDAVAVNTLEVVNTSSDSENPSLYNILNRCNTAMGMRLLKKWLLSPSRNLGEIYRRQSIVEFFTQNSIYRNSIKDKLKQVYDIERIASRIVAERSGPRDLIWLKNSISNLPGILNVLEEIRHPNIDDLKEGFDTLGDIYSLIENAITDEPPLNITEGGIIKSSFNNDIAHLREIKDNSRKMLARIEAQEKEKTGIPTLKVRYNKVFGYYIEISKTHSSKAPEHYRRKQTLVNAERFITDELKKLEDEILNAEDKLAKLEYDIFKSIRKDVRKEKDRIREVAGKVAELDVLLNFAEIADKYSYCRPEVGDFEEIRIIDGRHPVVENRMSEPFIPNDAFLDNSENNLLIITGPNMSGKSTYIRMVAINTLLAHTGSFIPAASAKISLVDRIFTRVGAKDNLAKGESTFMVEMVETANILNNATASSLIVLDEIGRGTSTFDGVSIAWAVAEYILNKIKAKTLFATHYHELTDIPKINSGSRNYTVEVKEWKNEVIFLRNIIEGSADRSYGVYVAKIAGLPGEVISRSNEIMATLEKNEYGIDGLPKLAKKNRKSPRTEKVVEPFLVFEEHPAVSELKSVNINDITPLEALNLLNKLKETVKDE